MPPTRDELVKLQEDVARIREAERHIETCAGPTEGYICTCEAKEATK